MAEKETVNEPKDVVEAVPEESSTLIKSLEKKEVKKLEEAKEESEKMLEESLKKEEKKLVKGFEKKTRAMEAEERKKEALASWEPKTKLGRDVKSGKIKDIDEILEHKKKILEAEIIDSLLDLETDLILIGQAKGKFGGGKRRAWRQTQRKTKEGNILSFSTMAVAGDRKGHIGIGYGKAKETLPAREKAVRNAKLNIIRVQRGFETPEKSDHDPHTVPFAVEGKCGSVKIKLLPAPRGTGLAIADECKKILTLSGIKDIYSLTKGKTRTTFNLAKACMNALSKISKMEL